MGRFLAGLVRKGVLVRTPFFVPKITVAMLIMKGGIVMKKTMITAICSLSLAAASILGVGHAAYIYASGTTTSNGSVNISTNSYFAPKTDYHFSTTAGYYKNNGSGYTSTTGNFPNTETNTTVNKLSGTGSGTNFITSESPSSGSNWETMVLPSLQTTWTTTAYILWFIPVTCTITATSWGLGDLASGTANSYLKKIVIRGDYNYIGTYAFASYSALEQVTFSSETTSALKISANAFYGDAKLLYVDLPAYVTSIGANAFGLANASASQSLQIAYNGTKSAFSAITLTSGWHTNRNVVVGCSDGLLFYPA